MGELRGGGGASVGSRERITVVAGESHGGKARSCCPMKELRFYPVGHGNYQTPRNRDTSEQMKG